MVACAQSPVLAISKSASPDPVVAGGELTYIITITNTGDVPLQGVVVNDEVPEHTTFSLMGARSGQWLMSGPNRGTRGPVIWKSAAPLAPGQAVQVQMVVWVDSGNQDPVTNTEYSVLADEGEKVRGEPVTTHVMLPTPTPTPTSTPMPPTPTRVPTSTPVPQSVVPTSTVSPTRMPTPVPAPGSPVRWTGLLLGIVGTMAIFVLVVAWFVKSKGGGDL
jgi:uncharacterized repeat protein (TIGR01451 family)